MNPLCIYNTLTRDKQIFVPSIPGEVRMYVCGMTVYDDCHLGHARVMVVFDMVQRWLKALGYQIISVRNITDIDDKIIRRALENQQSITSLTSHFIQRMTEDADALGVERPTHEPRATNYIQSMLTMIETLIHKGYAYQAPNGDVLYSVRQFQGYGKLSGKTLDDLRSGERVAIDEQKQDPLDFVLWKQAKSTEPDEAQWESPWGKGRPGWHIECSAMSSALLGQHFDIHGGGADLQFPHHENEIAQSEGTHDHPFVNYWMHNGFVRVDNEKMSKSLGNFFTVRDIFKKFDPEVIRFFILRAHYRSPLNYSNSHLEDARQGLIRLYTALKAVPAASPATPLPAADALDPQDIYAQRFTEAMNDDFNTPVALAVLFDLSNEIHKTRSEHLAAQLRALAGTLGLLKRDPQQFLQASKPEQLIDAAMIEQHITQRIAAKNAKNYAEADRIRSELLSMGIALEDRPNGQTEWRQV